MMNIYNEHPLNKRYDLDSVFNALWAFFKEHFVPLFVISFLFSLVSGWISSRLDLTGLQQNSDPYEILRLLKSMAWQYFLLMLVSFFSTLVLQYYILRKPVDNEGDIIKFAGRVIVRFLLPMLIVFIVLSIFAFVAAIVGFLILIIGIFFALIYISLFFVMAAPVMMVEECSIGDTISRTFSLVHKRFWPNIGWMAIFLILLIVASLVLGGLAMVPFSGGFLKSIFNPDAAAEVVEMAKRPLFIILTSAAGAVTMPLMPIFGLILYFNGVSWETSSSGNGEGYSGPSVEDLTP